MNKAELIENVSEKTGLTKKNTEAVINSFVSSVQETLARGEKIKLVGFGVFETRYRKARIGRNPQKPGIAIEIAASKSPAFKAGKAFRDMIVKKGK